MKVRSASGSSRSRGVGPVAGLVAGQTVRGRVIAKLGAGRFRVGTAGYLFDATSELPLEPGQKLTARVELSESQIFLRILENHDRHVPTKSATESPEEIRRILEGLGYHPDDLEISEFLQRLNRYQRHSLGWGWEPSDVWVLAILWIRGVRSGADNFALLSYYLRQIIAAPLESLQLPPTLSCLNLLASVSISLIQPPDKSNPTPAEIATKSLDQYLLDRSNEAVALLNRDPRAHGRYLNADVGNTVIYSMQSDDNLDRFCRCTDHPVSPRYLLEMALAQSHVMTRLYRLETDDKADNILWEKWIESSMRMVRESGLELACVETSLVNDVEELRFKFWKKWGKSDTLDDKPPLCGDLTT